MFLVRIQPECKTRTNNALWWQSRYRHPRSRECLYQSFPQFIEFRIPVLSYQTLKWLIKIVAAGRDEPFSNDKMSALRMTPAIHEHEHEHEHEHQTSTANKINQPQRSRSSSSRPHRPPPSSCYQKQSHSPPPLRFSPIFPDCSRSE